MVSDIPPEDGKIYNLFYSVVLTMKSPIHCSEMEKYNQVVADILGQEVNEETFRQTICTIHPCTLLYGYNTTCTIPPSTIPSYHGRRNFKDINPLMSSALVILFGVAKQFGRL